MFRMEKAPKLQKAYVAALERPRRTKGNGHVETGEERAFGFEGKVRVARHGKRECGGRAGRKGGGRQRIKRR